MLRTQKKDHKLIMYVCFFIMFLIIINLKFIFISCFEVCPSGATFLVVLFLKAIKCCFENLRFLTFFFFISSYSSSSYFRGIKCIYFSFEKKPKKEEENKRFHKQLPVSLTLGRLETNKRQPTYTWGHTENWPHTKLHFGSPA